MLLRVLDIGSIFQNKTMQKSVKNINCSAKSYRVKFISKTRKYKNWIDLNNCDKVKINKYNFIDSVYIISLDITPKTSSCSSLPKDSSSTCFSTNWLSTELCPTDGKSTNSKNHVTQEAKLDNHVEPKLNEWKWNFKGKKICWVSPCKESTV